MNWFEYTNDKIEIEDDVLYRTKYLVDFKDKKAGDLSGYVSKKAKLPDNPILIDSESYIGKDVSIAEDVEIFSSKIFGSSTIWKDIVIENSSLNGVRFLSYGARENKSKIKNSKLKNTKGQNFDIVVGVGSFIRIIDSTILCHVINVDGCISCGSEARLDIVDSNIEIGTHPICAQDCSGLCLKKVTVKKVIGRLGEITAKKKGTVCIENTTIDCFAKISCKNLNVIDSKIYGEIVATDNRGASLRNCAVNSETKILLQKNTMVDLTNVRLTGGSSIEIKESSDGGIVRFYGVDTVLQKNSKIVVYKSEKDVVSRILQCILEHTVVENSQLKNCILSVDNNLPVNGANISNCHVTGNAKIGYDIYGKKCDFLINVETHGVEICNENFFSIFPITEEKAIVCTPDYDVFTNDGDIHPFGLATATRDEIKRTIKDAPYPLNDIPYDEIYSFVNSSLRKFLDLIVKDIGFDEVSIANAAYIQTILSVMSNSDHVFGKDKIADFCNFVKKNTVFDIGKKKVVGIRDDAFFIPSFVLNRYESALTDDPIKRAALKKAFVI